MASSKRCHGGLLWNRTCEVEPAEWRRVCQQCLSSTDSVPEARCRLLAQPYGTFASERRYYVQWSLDRRVLARSVKPFKLKNTTALLLVFASEDEAQACERMVPAELLEPAQPHHCQMRMCNIAKTFCPAINFSDSAATSCSLHRTARPAVAQVKEAQPVQATTQAPPQQPVQAMQTLQTLQALHALHALQPSQALPLSQALQPSKVLPPSQALQLQPPPPVSQPAPMQPALLMASAAPAAPALVAPTLTAPPADLGSCGYGPPQATKAASSTAEPT
eukprot:4499821-Prymnesium_polylepis.1